MKRAHVTRAEMEAFPEGAVWNAFVRLMALADSRELSPEQLPAHRAFWYDSEVQNGGHLQYFLNRGIDEARSAIGELRRLGATDYGNLLEKAVTVWENQRRTPPKSASQYVDMALNNDLEHFDTDYYSMSPTLIEVLEAHLSANQDQYVSIE